MVVLVIVVGGVTIGAAVAEHRLNMSGYTNDAKAVRTFGRFFLVGSGTAAVWYWVTAAISLFG